MKTYAFDILALASLGMVAGGCYWLHPAAALIFLGLIGLYACVRLAAGKEKPRA